MKKILSCSAIICLCFLFVSCKKDKNENTDYYISAKVGGELVTYKTNAVAVKEQTDTIYNLALTAFGDVTTGQQFYLQIAQVNNPITAGTYVDAGDDALLVVGGYNPGTTDDSKIFAAGLQVDSNPRLQITISSLTSTNVSGTFSGTYYDNGGDGPGIVAVTDGKFNLQLH
ncbi:MAG: hypothetical protein ABI416_15520 [Ginsengibacter sp.]